MPSCPAGAISASIYTTAPADSGPQTDRCLIAVTPDGQPSKNTYLGAARELAITDLNEADIAGSGVLYISGYLWDAPTAKAASRKAIDMAKKAGTLVAFSLSDPFLMGRYRGEFRELLQQLDILFAYEDEAKALFEVSDFDDVLQAFKPMNKAGAITRSKKGCTVVRGAEVHFIEGAPVDRVIDTIAARDQFAA